MSVRISPDVVGRLAIAVFEGFKALPRRGLETGGLLIGTRRETGTRVVIEICDFEPVESEHAAGPSYLLSEGDRRLLAARIAAYSPRVPKTSIVGFYRSHTRRDFAITVEDEFLFSTYFRHASDVFLLIKSNDEGPPTGGFIIREQGQILSNCPYAQFPLVQTLAIPAVQGSPLPVIRTRQPARDQVLAVAAAAERSIPALRTLPPPVRESPIVPSPESPQKTWLRRWPVWLAMAGVALVVVLVAGIQRRPPGTTSAHPSPSLGLNVTNSGGGLRLSWDHWAAAGAGKGFLWINDGQEQRRFELDSRQLREGSVTYWPHSKDVNFRLELLPLQGSTLAESVRVIGGPASVPVADSESPADKPPAGAPAVSPSPEIFGAPPASPTSPLPPQRLRNGTASRQMPRAFAAPAPKPGHAAPAPATLPDLPTVAMAAPPLETGSELRSLLAPANRPGPREGLGSVRVSVEPVAASRLEQFARNIPLVGKRYRRSDYVPPTPLANQELPDPSSGKVTEDLNIDVRVYVNPSGKVDFTELASNVAKRDADLAASAVFSARRWEFVPARSKDGAVPGQVILHFQFLPGFRR